MVDAAVKLLRHQFWRRALSTISPGTNPLCGTAGFYTAEKLSKRFSEAKVDILDRLPTPFGLVRSGIALDLPDIKTSAFTLNSQWRAASTSTESVVILKKNGKDAVKKEEVPGSIADMRILRTLSSYVWPKENLEFRRRVLVALGLLVGSKVLNVQVPFLFKHAIDSLSTSVGATGVTAAVSMGNPWLVAPVAVFIGYGIARAGASACNELRNAGFAKVAQGTIRTVARKVFLHLHCLDLTYRLSRQTGAMNRTIDRGTRAINFILTSMVFNVVPTILEISMVAGILAYKFGTPFAWLTSLTVVAYTAFT